MPDFSPVVAASSEVVMTLTDSNLVIANFNEYSFNSNFLTPSDGWDFTIGSDKLTDDLRRALRPGAAISLSIDGAVQATGFIDAVEVNASRDLGVVHHISGRDILSPVCDACADPTQQLKEGQTLEDAVKLLLGPYGWPNADMFVTDNEANKDVKTAQYRAKTKRSEKAGFGRHALKEYKLHQNKPYPKESVFEFATRMSQRFGLWLWASADGKKIILAEPNFDNTPTAQLIRKTDGTTNVLEGSVKLDVADQPSLIVADAYSRGGEFGRSGLVAIAANTAIRVVDPQGNVQQLPDNIQKYLKAGAKVVTGAAIPIVNVMDVRRHRILYLHDDESQTLDQLTAYVLREMALLQRKSLSVTYTVEGHGQNTPSGIYYWTVDDVVQVVDDAAGLSEVLYVLGRTFRKSRSSGTTTHLELIRLGTLVFSDGGVKPQ